jgi:hypothetical protein
MSKVDTTQPGNIGEYYGKADLQLEFVPSQTVPFKLTAIKTGMTAGGCTGVTVSSQRQGGALQCSVLNEGQRRSLLQPVLVQAETGTQQASFFCPNLATAQAGMPSVNASLKSEVVRALQTAIVSQTAVLPYSSITSNLSSLSAISSSFSTNLNAIAGLTATEKTALLASTPEKIAAVNNGCFLPPAIKAIQNSFYDQREERYINLLQVNLRSLSDRSDPAIEKYSGGLNNLMRFHEIWTGINFNYSGSLVSVGTPQEFSGRIKASGDLKYYMPPIRNWAYDTTFDRFEDLPPLSPRVIYLQQQVFKRNYN